jgi:hypothetical protein
VLANTSAASDAAARTRYRTLRAMPSSFPDSDGTANVTTVLSHGNLNVKVGTRVTDLEESASFQVQSGTVLVP